MIRTIIPGLYECFAFIFDAVGHVAHRVTIKTEIRVYGKKL